MVPVSMLPDAPRNPEPNRPAPTAWLIANLENARHGVKAAPRPPPAADKQPAAPAASPTRDFPQMTFTYPLPPPAGGRGRRTGLRPRPPHPPAPFGARVRLSGGASPMRQGPLPLRPSGRRGALAKRITEMSS